MRFVGASLRFLAARASAGARASFTNETPRASALAGRTAAASLRAPQCRRTAATRVS
jgi:hypothetical protein